MMFFLMVLMSILVCSTEASAADDGVNVNGLQVLPYVEVAGQYSDNAGRTGARKIGAWSSIVHPSVDITAGEKHSQLTVHYELEKKYDNSQIDAFIDHFIDAEVHQQIFSRSVVDMSASYKKGHDSRGTIFSGIVTGFNNPDKWHELSSNAVFSYGAINAKGRIEFNGGYSRRRYDNHRTLTVQRDVDTAEGGVAFYYMVMPKTSVVIEVDYSSIDYVLPASLLDSDEVTILGGLTWEATGKTNGTVELGWGRKSFKQGSLLGSNFFSWKVLIDWSPKTYSVWSLSSGYQANETDGGLGLRGNGNYIKSSNVDLTWDHKWSERVRHNLSASFTHDQYVGSFRKDDTILASFLLDYTVFPWLELGLEYNYSKRSSNQLLADYIQNIYGISLTGTL